MLGKRGGGGMRTSEAECNRGQTEGISPGHTEGRGRERHQSLIGPGQFAGYMWGDMIRGRKGE